jgi:hypothetical protein
MGLSLQAWLDDEDNLEKWEDGRLTASERRIMLTRFLGEAFQEATKTGLVRSAFEKTGTLIMRFQCWTYLVLVLYLHIQLTRYVMVILMIHRLPSYCRWSG